MNSNNHDLSPAKIPNEEYEFVHGNALFEVGVFYAGKGTLVDIIKDSIKRDFELEYNSKGE